MNDNKKRLIHTAFRIAQVTNKKLYMSSSDYKKFYKSCEYSGLIGPGNGADYTRDLVISDYTEAYQIGALILDQNTSYGGYRLDILSDGGGISHFLGSSRNKAEALADILNAFCSGVHYAKKGEV